MTSADHIQAIEKLATGIPGFDLVAMGGLSKGRVTLVTGAPGSGKTIFASQFLAAGIERGENVVFVTFEESPSDICQNVVSLGWDIAAWQRADRWAFVDASPQPADEVTIAGSFDLGGLMARIEHAVRRRNATRVSLDSISSMLSRFADQGSLRHELHRLLSGIKDLGVTAILTAERAEDAAVFDAIAEFVADNVVVLRNTLEEEKRRRTIEILKFRGTAHQKGEFPFTVTPDRKSVV